METSKFKYLIVLIAFLFSFNSLAVKRRIDLVVPSEPGGDVEITTTGQIIIDGTPVFETLTNDRALYINTSSQMVPSIVTQAELEHLSGATQNIQSGLDGKVEQSDYDTTTQDIYTQLGNKLESISGTAGEIEVTGGETVGIVDDPVIPGSGAITVPSGTVGERPGSPINGMFRYSETDNGFEGYANGAWGPIAGGGGGGSDLSAVTQDIVPDADSTYDIGLTGSRWAEGYFDDLFTTGTVTAETVSVTTVEATTVNATTQNASQLIITSTQDASISCPVMTTAQRDAISSPLNGSCVYDSNSGGQYNYNSTTSQWIVNGSIVETENITDWQSFTPQLLGTVTNPTVTTVRGRWRRVGSDMEIEADFEGITAIGSGLYYIVVPNSELIDTSKVTISTLGTAVPGTSTIGTIVGEGNTNLTSGSYSNFWEVVAVANNELRFFNYRHNLNSDLDFQRHAAFGSANYFTNPSNNFRFKAKFPIQGWVSTTAFASVESGNADEYYTTTSASVTLWDSTGDISTFDTSLIDLSNSRLLQWNDTTQTRLVAKRDLFLSLTAHGRPSTNSSLLIYNSSGQAIANSERSDSGYSTPASINVKLTAGDYVYMRMANAQSTTGGLSFTARPVESTRLVSVSGRENLYTARVQNNGAASIISQSGDWIDSVSFDATGRVSVGFKAGLFTVIPSITVDVEDSVSHNATISTPSTSAVQVRTFVTNTTTYADKNFTISVKKQGTDYKEPKVYIGNVDPDGFVKTDGITEPKLFSAKVSSGAVVSGEIGDFINGNCTNTSPNVCTFNSVFNSTVNCTVSESGASSGFKCEFDQEPSPTDVRIKCFDSSGVDVTTSVQKNLICHGY